MTAELADLIIYVAMAFFIVYLLVCVFKYQNKCDQTQEELQESKKKVQSLKKKISQFFKYIEKQ